MVEVFGDYPPYFYIILIVGVLLVWGSEVNGRNDP